MAPTKKKDRPNVSKQTKIKKKCILPPHRLHKKKKKKKIYDQNDISKWLECLLYLLPVATLATEDLELCTTTLKHRLMPILGL